MIYFTDYNYLDRLKEFFDAGWSIEITQNIPSDGMTYCTRQLIQMKLWDIHLLAHELTHAFLDCKLQ